MNFYRLKQFDNDGRFHFSDMIAIDWNTEKEVGLTFMNPSRNGVAVQVTNPEGSAFRLSAITPSGQIAWQSPKIANQTTWSQTIPLPTGAYFLHLQLNNKTITERVIIQD